jgi:endonuclease YncB( thermonuclease family)
MRPYIASLLGRLTALFAIALAVAAPASAAGLDELEPGGRFVVAAVLDGDTLQLADGQILRLAAIAAPKPASGANARDAEAASQALAALAGGQQVELFYGGRHTDRHGRLLAHVRLIEADGAAGAWLQGELLTRGLARVSTTPDSCALAPEMLALESEARAAGRGLWAVAAYRIRTPEDVAAVPDSFQIVEGVVLASGSSGGRLYLNFGADRARDFTLALDTAARRLFREAGIDPAALVGRRIRVRGWVRWFDGPRIDLTHPEQMEVLP